MRAASLLGLLLGAAAAGAQPLPGGAAAPAAGDTTEAAPSERPLGQEWASAPFGGFAREVEVELYGTTRTAAPGGLVVVRYAVNSYEDRDARVRLRLRLPAGWALLDGDVEGREFELPSWETLEGEIRVLVPEDARAGGRRAVQVVGEVPGEPGGTAVYAYVQVTRRGGLRPGQVGLSGTATALATSFAVEDLSGARYGGALDLSGTLARQTTLSVTVLQGPRENALTNYRIAQEESRWNALLRSPAWAVQLGNQVLSAGTALSGPFVRGRGASVRRTAGLVVGELTVAQPTAFVGDPGGHLVRGSLGLSGSAGRVGLAFSDFGRPAGGYTTVPIYPPDIDPEELERLERERLAAERAARNRVQGGGLDAEVQLARVHRLAVRGGWLRLANAAGETAEGPSGEARYSLTDRRVSLNARWRHMPDAIEGVTLMGDEAAFDASVAVADGLRLAGRAHRTRSLTQGRDYRTEGDGAAAGVRYTWQAWRLDVSGGRRAWSYGGTPTVTRSVTVALGAPVGPLTLSGYADVGVQDNGAARGRTQSYRADLRWSGNGGTASWSAGYYETLSAPPRLRTDLLGAVKLGGWELAGGAWATHGLPAGGDPGFWAQVGVPLTYDFLLALGVERAPADWGQPPSWLGTVGLRTRLAFALPFLRDGSVPRAAPPSLPLPAPAGPPPGVRPLEAPLPGALADAGAKVPPAPAAPSSPRAKPGAGAAARVPVATGAPPARERTPEEDAERSDEEGRVVALPGRALPAPLRGPGGVEPSLGGATWVVASGSQAGGETAASRYRQQGYRADVLAERVRGRVVYRVVVGQFASFDEALRHRAALPPGDHAGAWVLRLE